MLLNALDGKEVVSSTVMLTPMEEDTTEKEELEMDLGEDMESQPFGFLIKLIKK